MLRMRRQKHDELTAAALLDMSDPLDRQYVRSTVTYSRNATRDAWKWYQKIGEVHYAVSRSAKLAGYARLRAVRLAPDGQIESEIDTGPAADVVAGIYSPFGGVRALLQRYYTLMKIPGDSYLVRCRDDEGEPDGWMFLSADELDVKDLTSFRPNGPVKWVTLPVGNNNQSRLVIDIQPTDFIGRVWTPSAQYVEAPDSPMLGLGTECEVLHELTESLKGKIRSRFALSGIMFIPNEISNINIGAPTPDATEFTNDRVLNWLAQAMTRNVMNRDDASAWVPILLRGPGNAGEQIRHILLDTEIFEVDIKLRAELIQRILMGLDTQQNAVQGVGDTNHWAAWAVSDEERRISVQPDIESGCWALTRMILHRELLDMGMSPDEVRQYGVWYDLSAASVRANQQEDSRQLHDRYALSDAALRRVAGIADADRPSTDEYIRRVGVAMRIPRLALWGIDDGIDWEAIEGPSVTGPPPDPGGDEPAVGPGVGDPGSPDDRETDVPRSQRPA